MTSVNVNVTAFFLPRESGEGGPAEASETSGGWWKGRRTRRCSCDESEAPSQTPLPPCFATADASRRRTLRKERRPRAAYAPSPLSRGRISAIVLATLLCARALPRHCKKALPSTSQKKGGGAPVGASLYEPHQIGCGGGFSGSRPPIGAPPRARFGESTPLLSSSRASWVQRHGVSPHLACPSPASSSQTGH